MNLPKFSPETWRALLWCLKSKPGQTAFEFVEQATVSEVRRVVAERIRAGGKVPPDVAQWLASKPASKP